MAGPVGAASVNIANDVRNTATRAVYGVAGLPTADIDGAGNIYVIWSDCRFRANCNANDLVLSTSSNGDTWTSPARLPMVPVSSAVDLFIPGLGVDHATSGASAHLTVTTYAYSNTNCSKSTCQLYVGFHDLQRRRQDLDGGESPGGTHEPELAAQFAERIDGGGLS